MNRTKVGVLICLTLAMLIFAIVRVAPYLSTARPDQLTPEQRQIVRVITGTKIPEYDVELLREDVDQISELVRRRVYQLLLELPAPQRPTQADAESISREFARFYALNRSGTREQAIAGYAQRGIQPPHVLVQPDQAKAENGWKLSTAWARQAEPRVEAMTVHAVFLRGIRSRPERFNGASIEARQLAGGGYLSIDNHRYTAYEIVVPSAVPNLDGKEIIEVDVCVSIVNDRANGQWDVAEVTWDNLPQGKRFRLPLP